VFEGHPLTVEEAAELAQFCFSDAYRPRDAEAAPPQPAERTIEGIIAGAVE
jgi:hypothetical protein